MISNPIPAIDHKKIYAAFDQATKTEGKPTVLLIKTVKGDGMGAQGKNTAHQYKNMPSDERVRLAAELKIPLSKEDAEKDTVPFWPYYVITVSYTHLTLPTIYSV